MNPDKYHGTVAERYDVERCHSLRWAREQLAVADFVRDGPVLDVPLGTGRYGEIYRERGLKAVGVDVSADMLALARKRYPEIVGIQGSVLALPFDDKAFATACCTRLLDWLDPVDMAQAVAELRRVASVIVASIRHGVEEIRVNQTHDLANWYRAIDGLFIEARRVTEITQDGTEEIFRLRAPTWDDVLAQFQHHGHTPYFEMQRIACEWFGHVQPSPETHRVTSTYWPAADLVKVIDWMASKHDATAEPDDRYRTDLYPRFEHGPVTLMTKGKKTVVLDGRRRINRWRGSPGLFPVLLIEWQR